MLYLIAVSCTPIATYGLLHGLGLISSSAPARREEKPAEKGKKQQATATVPLSQDEATFFSFTHTPKQNYRWVPLELASMLVALIVLFRVCLSSTPPHHADISYSSRPP